MYNPEEIPSWSKKKSLYNIIDMQIKEMKKTKRVLLVMVILLITIVSFIVGGFVGFSKGTFYGLCASAPSDATMILTTIDRIKNNHVQAAIDLLESDLNSKMIEHRLLIKEGQSLFNLHSYVGMELGFNETSLSLMKKVAQYRMENPLQEKDSEVAATVDEAIKFYLSNNAE